MSPLGKDKTRREGLKPLFVILPLNHYSYCETMFQALLSFEDNTPLTLIFLIV